MFLPELIITDNVLVMILQTSFLQLFLLGCTVFLVGYTVYVLMILKTFLFESAYFL